MYSNALKCSKFEFKRLYSYQEYPLKTCRVNLFKIRSNAIKQLEIEFKILSCDYNPTIILILLYYCNIQFMNFRIPGYQLALILPAALFTLSLSNLGCLFVVFSIPDTISHAHTRKNYPCKCFSLCKCFENWIIIEKLNVKFNFSELSDNFNLIFSHSPIIQFYSILL